MEKDLKILEELDDQCLAEIFESLNPMEYEDSLLRQVITQKFEEIGARRERRAANYVQCQCGHMDGSCEICAGVHLSGCGNTDCKTGHKATWQCETVGCRRGLRSACYEEKNIDTCSWCQSNAETNVVDEEWVDELESIASGKTGSSPKGTATPTSSWGSPIAEPFNLGAEFDKVSGTSPATSRVTALMGRQARAYVTRNASTAEMLRTPEGQTAAGAEVNRMFEGGEGTIPVFGKPQELRSCPDDCRVVRTHLLTAIKHYELGKAKWRIKCRFVGLGDRIFNR